MVIKRLNHSDPHVVMQAITLLDACVSNCGKQFHLEIASRDFETEFRKLLQKSQPIVNTRLKLCLKKWAESEFKSDPQLNLIPSLYGKLRAEGHDFSDPSVTPKREAPLSKDPNVVSSQQEEEDIAKAIELSLKETKSSTASSSQSPKMHATSGGTATASSSLYPSLLPSSSSPAPVVEPRKVRALYDFEAAEDNELTFHTGEVIMVLDDSDPNWWKGQNQRGEGLFPSNFVTSDLNAEPEGATKTKKNVQFSDEQKKEEEEKIREQVVEIDEEKIDRLLHLLHEADPEDPSADTDEMLQLEHMVNQMGPLIDTELERVDRRHAQLTQLSSDLVEAINLYHTLMREPDRSMMMGPPGYGMGGYPGQPPMSGMYSIGGMYGQNMAGMYPGMGGMPGAMPPYGMGPLRHDMAQMGVSAIPQFPSPQQAMPTMSQNGPSSLPPQQISTSGAPTAGIPSLGQQPIPAGQPPMHQHMPPQPGTQPPQTQHMPNMSTQQPPTSAAPHMMNMGHIQSQLPPNLTNPTSSPPSVSSAPTCLPQQQQPPQAPVVSNQSGISRPQMSQHHSVAAPAGNFPYGAVQPSQQHPQGPPNGPVTLSQPPTATAPPPMNMNHHPQPPSMAPVPSYQTTGLPPYMQMPPGSAPGGFPPISTAHHHMLGHMIPPQGSPLSINTATNSPQNIPIYQQQR